MKPPSPFIMQDGLDASLFDKSRKSFYVPWAIAAKQRLSPVFKGAMRWMAKTKTPGVTRCSVEMGSNV